MIFLSQLKSFNYIFIFNICSRTFQVSVGDVGAERNVRALSEANREVKCERMYIKV